MYFEFPYINDKTDRQIQKVFKDTGLPVRLYRKSFTLRNALRPRRRREECQKKNCTLNNDLCLTKNCVYQLTCQECKESYIGSTARPFHTRLHEHLTQDSSSVSSHRKICRADFTPKILARDNDTVKLRFKEALLIKSHGATINSRAEREELQHLIC
jgi:hypothetical protein